VHETARGQRLRLGEFSGPCTVDKAAVLDGRGYSATWVAAKPARLRLLPGDVLLGLIEELPEVRRHVLRYLAAQLRDLHAELARVSFDDTTARVAAWLVCATRNTGPRVLLPGAQEGLAETVGASRVSVNRALRNLAREGWVRVEPGVVVVLAPESLAIRAECGGPAR
jgi:CRP/FNR family cyclic AMP-dependent transcriptional regulator